MIIVTNYYVYLLSHTNVVLIFANIFFSIFKENLENCWSIIVVFINRFIIVITSLNAHIFIITLARNFFIVYLNFALYFLLDNFFLMLFFLFDFMFMIRLSLPFFIVLLFNMFHTFFDIDGIKIGNGKTDNFLENTIDFIKISI